MSLILEALRKSERERAGNSGASAPAAVPRRQPMPLRERRGLGAGLVAALVFAGLALVWLLRDGGPEPGSETRAAAPSAPAPGPGRGASRPAAAAPAVSPSPARRASEPAREEEPAAVEEAAAVEEPEVIDLSAQLGAPAPRPAPPQTEPAPPQAPGLIEMPPDFQAAVPALDIQVHFYARDPDRRFVLIGGRRFRAGEQLMPGLELEEIVREGLLVEWGGERFVMPARR